MRPPEAFLTTEQIKSFQNSQYVLFGHAATKVCHWTKSSLKKGVQCYKNQFYGITSHQCVQMTPIVNYCGENCVFCWRHLNSAKPSIEQAEDAKEIVRESIKAQLKMLQGFGAQKATIGEEKWQEAMHPRHVAISLTGEPTSYIHISTLIEEYHKLGMSTFVVSNGLNPEVLQQMTMPTQLYISLETINPEMHKKINVPIEKNSWQKLMKTLEILPTLKTRTVVRITAVKGLNTQFPKELGELVAVAKPMFLEIKSYMHIGQSRKRLERENMMSMKDLREFGNAIAETAGYSFKDESKKSLVALFVRNDLKDYDTKIDFAPIETMKIEQLPTLHENISLKI